jgi:tetratricopeptide (TPR) repeat protein
MKKILLPAFLIIGLVAFPGNDVSGLTDRQLDALMFRQLESGSGDPSVQAQEIIRRSEEKASLYLTNAFTVLGIVNKNRGYYVSALNYYLKALNTASVLGDKGRISACLNNIGIIYELQENYPKAIQYFERSLKIEEKLHQPLQKSIRLFNLGDCYFKSGSYEEALGYYTASLLIERKEGNALGVAFAQLGMAGVYLRTNRITDATSALQMIRLPDGDPELQILFLKRKGECELALSHADEARALLEEAALFSNRTGFRNELLEIYWLLAELHQGQKNPVVASAYYRKYIALNRELQSSLVRNQIEDMTYQQALQRKELEIRYLREQRRLAVQNAGAMKALRQMDWKIALFSIAALVTLVLILVSGIKRLTGKTA